MTALSRRMVMALALAFLWASSGHAAVFDVTSYGADPAFAGIDSAGAQAAVDAACAAGGGEVHFPAGFYRLGRDTGVGTGFYSGLQVFCDDIVVSGVGDASVLMPLNSQGQTVITVCAEYSGGQGDRRCVFTNPVNNVTIRDLKIWDDDPLAHAGSEESHGVVVKNGHHVTVERLTLEDLGDESVTFSGGSTNGIVRESTFLNCPSLQSSGSCVELDRGSGYTVVGNTIEGGARVGSMINVNNNTAHEVTDVLIENNHLVELDTAPSQRISAGIWIAPNNAAIRNVRILNNTILNNHYNRDAIRISTPTFTVEDLLIQNNTLEGTVDLRSYTQTGLVFEGNSLVSTEGFQASALTFSGDQIRIADNVISGQRAVCIEIGGLDGHASNVEIRGNYCASNSDNLSDPIIREADLGCDPFSSVSSGLIIEDNWLAPTGKVTNGIELASCSDATVKNNVLLLVGSGANYGIRGGHRIQDNAVVGANVGVRTMAAPAQVTGNSVSGNTGVLMDTTTGAFVFGNDLGNAGLPIQETNGANTNACWDNVGVADGCSLILPCHDGIDNDGDGLTDAADPVCTPANPYSESSGTTSCGLGPELVPLLLAFTAWRRRLGEPADPS